MLRKVLIVDDNAINRQMLVNVLEKDYDIIEAENGKEALKLMHRNFRILSAVLLDIVMPEMDGYDVLRSMRENAMLAQIPVIMVTGSENEEARAKALSLGANDFIIKPFNPEIVKHCLKNNIMMRENASILNAIQKDKLTGLYNRETFFEKAGAMIKNREPGYYILSCFDIDNFKLINDQYGAAEGDNILREIGQAVKSSLNSIGGLAGRISADNFTALFPASERDEDILTRIQEKMPVLLEQRYIAFSIGRYIVSDTTLPVSAIYDRAYIAKQSVKGRFDKHMAYFDEVMLQDLIRDQQIVSDMEKALAEHQFEIWFQPQYNHANGTLTGAEALVRWCHPKKGIISPGEFIPLFEKNGFVYELDKYVWREACRYLRSWMDRGFSPLPVSVNMSRYDIFRMDLIETITGLIEEFNIPIELLRLEITESAFAKTTNIIVDIVKQLIDIGFIVEIDDFGSGYSSLNTLKSVPAQVVKLDMRFLEYGDDEQRGGNILESVVRMAKWLGMSVIAEGVETKEQGDFLKSIGCNHIQGYLYARPMPAEEYEKHFRDALKEDKIYTLETIERYDNSMFWNPASMDSLIFNSYVGSACIYEYSNGRIELIRVTDKYAQMLGGEKMTVDGLIKLDIMKYMDKGTWEEVFAQIEDSIDSKDEITGEFVFIDLPGCSREVHIRSNMRIVASTDNRHLIYCTSENITAQRVSEQKERNTAKQLRIIMDNINCGITAVSIREDSAEYLLANDKFYELLGYSKDELHEQIGADSLGVVYQKDRKRIAGIVEDARSTGVPASMEYRAVGRDGKIIWLRSFLSITNFEDVDGKIQLCTYADITAERNTAQNLLDNLPCGAGICMVNENDAYMTYLNKRYYTYFKNHFGIEHTVSIFDMIHPDDHNLLRGTMRHAFDRGGEGTCVVRIKDGPDQYIHFRITGAAIESENNYNAIYVTFVPISHEELSFSEMLYIALEKMMMSSSDLSFIKDKNLRYICCSQTFAQMVGLKSEKDVIGKTDYDLFEAKLADQYVSDDRRLIDSGKSIVDMVETIPSEDGKRRYSSTSKYLLYDSKGEIVGLYGTGHDITRIRETEAQQKFLINNIPGGVAIYEGQWTTPESIKLTYFSDGFCTLFGYTREEYEKLGRTNPMGLVAEDYLAGFVKQIESLVRDNKPIDYIYRAVGKDGHHRWIHIKAVRGEKHGDNMTVNAILFDVTSHQDTLEHLKVSEEENRLAIRHSENVVCRYDVAGKSLRVSSSVSPMFNVDAIIENVPYGPVEEEKISPETADAYIGFYEDIIKGGKNGRVVFQRKSTGGWRWIKGRSSTIFSSDNLPVSAVVSFVDVTESFEKDAAYKKWMQSLHNSRPESYSLFRCNISKRTVFDTAEGELINIDLKSHPMTITEYTQLLLDKYVIDDDRELFSDFMDVGTLRERYYGGERIIAVEFRERLHSHSYRWLRLTIDLVEYPHSNDIEAYLLFEDIDKIKRAELLTIQRAEKDPLTAALNRNTFEREVNKRIHDSKPNEKHALIMLDIDSFKLVNDTFGHSVGDEILIELTDRMKKILRREDLVGRLGGDEFFVFLNSIPDEKIAETKAKQICELSRRNISAEVQISGSVGISMYPHDGLDFETLYKRADRALYYVKGSGRDNYAFYCHDMENEHLKIEPDILGQNISMINEKKRRMLIVDDNKIDNQFLANIFKNDFMIENAADGNTALIRLTHYGSAISVVLLDLMMPGIDGFEVLEQMQKNPQLQMIPVVVVSGAEDREISLRAIRSGASDFVTKPVDADVLRIRVESAITKADNEKLRVKNSFLELQNAEAIRYKSIMRMLGLAVVEMDWGKGTFVYGHSISRHLWGKYDGRALWHILLSDLVASATTVKDIQQMIHSLADDRKGMKASIRAMLKTPTGSTHEFSIDAYKVTNEYGLTDKLYITFKDMGADGKYEG